MKARLIGFKLESSNKDSTFRSKLIIEVELDREPKEGLNDPEMAEAVKEELFGVHTGETA